MSIMCCGQMEEASSFAKPVLLIKRIKSIGKISIFIKQQVLRHDLINCLPKLMTIIIALTLMVCIFWIAQGIMPQIEAQANSATAKSMVMLILIFIIILLILKSPWCQKCYLEF